MARTHRESGRRGRGRAGRPVRLPKHRKRRTGTPNGPAARFLRFLGLLFLCAVVAAVAFAAGAYLGLIAGVERLGAPRAQETYPTYIYSAPLGDNENSRRVIGTILEGQNRKTASLSEMPPQLLNAVVAKEDERFRTHGGVDLWGIMRALYVDIRAGEAVEGASTITQQYVRNAYLTQDRSITRKVKEALIAIEVERKEDSKDQIIADYLNTVYFGSAAYGVEAAAETYFNKSVEDLSIAESATLVGLLWSPSTLGEDREGALSQRNLVLRKMFDTGYITSEDYNAALEAPMPENWPMNPPAQSGFSGPGLTRNFADYAHDELIRRYGANTVLQGGLSVYTTIDLEDQVAARDIAYGSSGYLPNADDPDLALVSIEPGTGHIKAMLGDRDENAQFSLATQGRRQPGSSFKVFALIAALEQGIDPETTYVSEEKEYKIDVGLDKPEPWRVQNYDGIVRGRISLEEALWYSDNTVFADLVMNADGRGLKDGPEKIAEVAEKCGITVDLPRHPKPSIVLGAYEVSPLDMASAYATIANGGRRVEPTAITRVVSDEGREDEKVLYQEPDQPEGEQVIPVDIAHKATEIMVGDVTQGIAGDAALEDRPVAGKTGTSENFFDAWFVGYTPQLVTSTWMGYAEGGDTLEYVLDYARELDGLPGGINPAMVWQAYMQQVLQGKPVEQFEGVTLPESEETTTPTAPERGTANDGPALRERAPADRRARGAAGQSGRAAVTPVSAAPASASSSASPGPSRTRNERLRANRKDDVGAGNAPSSAASSSASPASPSPASAAPR
ncbi:MAG TPA: transglycosylase domain-containing protein [Rubrobacter sp.]|nr:transglycosylase domain-containing protein [Rubrobacter sp.]